jgi:hypothetical protein
MYLHRAENFIQHLLKDFPKEEKALRMYCDKIRSVQQIPFVQFTDGE